MKPLLKTGKPTKYLLPQLLSLPPRQISASMLSKAHPAQLSTLLYETNPTHIFRFQISQPTQKLPSHATRLPKERSVNSRQPYHESTKHTPVLHHSVPYSGVPSLTSPIVHSTTIFPDAAESFLHKHNKRTKTAANTDFSSSALSKPYRGSVGMDMTSAKRLVGPLLILLTLHPFLLSITTLSSNDLRDSISTSSSPSPQQQSSTPQ